MIDPGPFDGPGPPRDRAGSGPRRWLALVAAVLVVLAIGGGVVLFARDRGSGTGASPTAPATVSGSPSPSAAPTDDEQQSRAAALAALLGTRERAVREHDLDGWLSTIDPTQTAFRAAQQAEFANLVRLPISRWHYTYDVPGPDLSTVREAALGGPAWIAEVDLGYRLGAADRTDVHSAESLTLVERPTGWLIAGDTDGQTNTEVWDLGPLTVVDGKSSIVVGIGSPATLKPYAAQADSAVTRVSAVWGRSWPRRVVVIVPKTQAQMGRLLDRPSASLAQIAAVTTGELTAVSGRPAGGADQIIVNPAGFARLGALGRRVVITHETTHVAVRASTPRSVSIWLSEGFADYIGFSGVGLSRTDVAADVLGQVRRGIGPKQLPDEADFDAAQTTVGPAYSASWLACDLIADRFGPAKLIELYRVASGAITAQGGSGDQSPDEATRAAFPAVLGVSEAAFTRSWLRYLTALSRE